MKNCKDWKQQAMQSSNGRLLERYGFLNEAEGDESEEETPPEETQADEGSEPQEKLNDPGMGMETSSVDAQIDRFLSQYITAAKEDMDEGDIDLETFANDISRLVKNAKNMLVFQDAIIARAEKILKKDGEADQADGLVRMLRDVHGIAKGKTSDEVADEQFQPTYAVGSRGEKEGA